MPRKNKKKNGCLNFLMMLAILGGGYWWFIHKGNLNISQILPGNQETTIPIATPPPTPTPTPTPSEVIPNFPLPQTVPNGTTITIHGSTSMGQINEALKIAFQQTYLNTIVNTEAKGSDLGIQSLLAGKSNIAAISRPLTAREKQQGLSAIPVTQDGIAVIVGVNNRFRRGLSKEEIQGIFQGKITNWSEVGGENIPIRIINRPNTSGTRQIFEELVLNNGTIENRANVNPINQDSTQLILKALDKDGISYAAYSQVVDQENVRIVPVDGLIPEAAAYPYQRTLYYAYAQPATPAVKAFLGYVTSAQGKQTIETALLTPQETEITFSEPAQTEVTPKNPQPSPNPVKPEKTVNIPQTPWEKKEIRGIYLSRYQITNHADERTIRERVRYYRSQGINTIIHGVWGNGCTMYNSSVMQETLGAKSCPNLFHDQWLDWLIDEAHKQGMEVHAYFEKGIKIDKNSPIFDRAVRENWLVPGVDKTYGGIDHYVLNVENPEVASLFKNIVVEFVQKYPKIDAVQWDDYLGYHAELPGQVNRTANLTKFLQEMISAMKKANPSVSFDICHHNPYWAKRYFAADWENWNVDRVFIQAYNEKNFKDELNYAQSYEGIAITERQFHRLKELIDNPKVNSVLIFPLSGEPEKTASNLKTFVDKIN